MKEALRILSLTVFLSLSVLHLGAQDRNLQFVYIAKDNTTDVRALMGRLKEIYSAAQKNRNTVTIFYLSYFESQVVVKVNLPDDPDPGDINEVYDFLTKQSETVVELTSDKEKILSLLDEIGFTAPDGSLSYGTMDLYFFVTPSFWNLRYNEELMAPIFFAAGLDELDPATRRARLRIYHHRGDGLSVDKEHPFGPKNLCPDLKFQLLTY